MEKASEEPTPKIASNDEVLRNLIAYREEQYNELKCSLKSRDKEVKEWESWSQKLFGCSSPSEINKEMARALRTTDDNVYEYDIMYALKMSRLADKMMDAYDVPSDWDGPPSPEDESDEEDESSDDEEESKKRKRE
jgi:hypothetical protein